MNPRRSRGVRSAAAAARFHRIVTDLLGATRGGPVDRERPHQLRAERASGGQVAGADQQPDHFASERGDHALSTRRATSRACRFRRSSSSSSRSSGRNSFLQQAQRIAYDVQNIDQAFQTTYGNASMSAFDQATRSPAARALAEHRRRPAGRHARPGGRGRQHRHQPRRDVGAGRPEPGRHRRAAGDTGRQPASRAAGAAACRSHRRRRRQRSRAELSTEAERPRPPSKVVSSAAAS